VGGESKFIIVRGARVHNLKSIDVVIPREKLTVITGPSGSGKSSLAFDTIYAEGQRRYVESLSPYARQFLGVMEKPDVDYIGGISPAISIEQGITRRNPRSTVGTITEIYDYLRLLFARVGTPYCYNCGREIRPQGIDQIVDSILSSKRDKRIIIVAPVVRGRKGEFKKIFEDARREGFVRARVDGKIWRLEEIEGIQIDKNKKHNIEIVVDRVVVTPENRKRIADSVEIATNLTEGLVGVVEDEELELYSKKLACVYCGISYPDLEPRLFSFNSPYGACPACGGLGIKMEFDPDLIIPDKSLSFEEDAILVLPSRSSWARDIFEAFSRKYNISPSTPIKDFPEDVYRKLLYGTDEELRFVHETINGKGRWESVEPYEGIIRNLERRYRETQSESVREWLESFMKTLPCPVCNGKRLRRESLAVKIKDKSIIDITEMTVDRELEFFMEIEFSGSDRVVAEQILKEIVTRLRFMKQIGIGYLSLDRRADTLSGGEAQRIRLATNIGSGLVGVLYVLDEPTIGLHQRDIGKLLDTLFHLRDTGNTLVVVEHDEQTIRNADYVVDLGPGAGENGGRVVAAGTPEQIVENPDSLTGLYLKGKLKIPVPEKRREGNGKWLFLRGVREHNLKNIDVGFPLGRFICVTGVSGSGKSSLVIDVLFPAIANRLNRASMIEGSFEKIEGIEYLDKVVNVDQSPIGKTPRSNPATYTGVFTPIRELFASLPESKMRGYGPGRFSFNVQGGRCENCQGQGTIRVEMSFMPDIWVTCEVCRGRRYNRETLEVKYRGKSIADVLEMTVDRAAEFFSGFPQIRSRLKTLQEVGLGYIRLGQPATTLSGGEAQRVKLSAELSRRNTGRTIYILDEPTTGLHFDDVRKLLDILNRLVDEGNTVVVIEHNIDVIKSADYIIDLGPEGGDEGGRIVATGTPEELAENPNSFTGFYLKPRISRKVAESS